MGLEIERKFLVKAEGWQQHVTHLKPNIIRQGYLNSDPERTVRIRQKGDKGYLTIKGKNSGMSRQEFEYEIPLEDAAALLQLCPRPLIEKKRYNLLLNGQLWEVDAFTGENQGLVLAEAELEHEQQKLEIPDWVEKEVTEDSRYYNSSLALNPYGSW